MTENDLLRSYRIDVTYLKQDYEFEAPEGVVLGVYENRLDEFGFFVTMAHRLSSEPYPRKKYQIKVIREMEQTDLTNYGYIGSLYHGDLHVFVLNT